MIFRLLAPFMALASLSCTGSVVALIPVRRADVADVTYTHPARPAPMAGDIYRPKADDSHPAVLMIHGDGRIGAPSDLTYYSEGKLIRNFLGGTLEEVPELFHEASPVNHVTPSSPPFFLYHGEDDSLVHPDHLREMEIELKANGVPHEIFWIRGKGHIRAFLFPDGAIEAAIRFLDRHLKG